MNATDLSAHPFSSENIAYELGTAASDAAWDRWYFEVERLLGHDLDGNDVDGVGCGYSIDEAVVYFERGATPHGYVVMVGSRERYRKPS